MYITKSNLLLPAVRTFIVFIMFFDNPREHPTRKKRDIIRNIRRGESRTVKVYCKFDVSAETTENGITVVVTCNT